MHATCGSRVRWASKHTTQGEANACAAAMVLILSDCPDECGECSAEGAGCGDAETLVMRKFQDIDVSQTRHSHIGGVAAVLGIASLSVIGFAIAVRSRHSRRSQIYRDVLLLEEA